jgi:hypothetical protein
MRSIWYQRRKKFENFCSKLMTLAAREAARKQTASCKAFWNLLMTRIQRPPRPRRGSAVIARMIIDGTAGIKRYADSSAFAMISVSSRVTEDDLSKIAHSRAEGVKPQLKEIAAWPEMVSAVEL